MRRKVTRALDWGSYAAIAAFLLWMAARLVPVWPWFEPRTLLVADSSAGEPVTIGYQRTIRRETLVGYTAVVRRMPGLEIVCEATAQPFLYRPGAELPHPVTLEWWTGGDCGDLPAGEYQLDTCWTLTNRLAGLLPERTACLTSNVFARH